MHYKCIIINKIKLNTITRSFLYSVFIYILTSENGVNLFFYVITIILIAIILNLIIFKIKYCVFRKNFIYDTETTLVCE